MVVSNKIFYVYNRVHHSSTHSNSFNRDLSFNELTGEIPNTLENVTEMYVNETFQAHSPL